MALHWNRLGSLVPETVGAGVPVLPPVGPRRQELVCALLCLYNDLRLINVD